MPLFVEVFVVVVVMLGAFFGVSLLIFLFAMAMLPVEKSLSKAIWDMTAPPKRKTSAQEGGFKTFSQKQQQKPGR